MKIISDNVEKLEDGFYLFSTPMCPTCDALKRMIATVELDTILIELNAYEHQQICQQLSLIGTPCLINYRDNREYDRLYGAPSVQRLVAFLEGE